VPRLLTCALSMSQAGKPLAPAHLVKCVAEGVSGICGHHQRGAPLRCELDRKAGSAARLPHPSFAAQHEVSSPCPSVHGVEHLPPDGAAKVLQGWHPTHLQVHQWGLHLAGQVAF
jgi:hypothetical protein